MRRRVSLQQQLAPAFPYFLGLPLFLRESVSKRDETAEVAVLRKRSIEPLSINIATFEQSLLRLIPQFLFCPLDT
ncbi:hypothetical protein L6452_39184 [Arctium lappa]|uniref:Uncharacterized protein n=1 Tax=Arctium lappa TaxID=4217 RepID=A0ACB8XS57_ARCLA|nr:hypothetical protein L6452_39184 [Arctium lappa]